MPTAEKAGVIEQAKDWVSRSSGVIYTEYRGLKVKELQTLRASLKSKGGEIHVLKNTLYRIAAGEDTVSSLPSEFHNGPTAFAFLFENEPDCAKALVDFANSSKKLVIKGGMIGTKTLTAKDVEKLSKLPPRDVLLAQVIGTIAAPLSNLVGVVEALYADPIRTIGAVADKLNEGGAPAPQAQAKSEPTPAEESAPTEAAEAATDAPAAETETPQE